MKTLVTIVITLLLSFTSFAQQSINYKAIINDVNGNALVNQTLIVQFVIRTENSSILYAENHPTTTDNKGLVVLAIGEGTPVFETYSNVDWTLGNLKLQVTIDSGNGLVSMGSTPFNAVPYALETLNPVFKKEGDDAFKEMGNVGIGTSGPQEELHINSPTSTGVLLTVPSLGGDTSIQLANGNITGPHTFYKIENILDKLRIQVDSDLTSETGYQEVLNINSSGDINTEGNLQLENGIAINEFSTDETLSENSDTKVPTERAIKMYVDNQFKVPEPFILGKSGATSDGRFQFGGKFGWHAAQKMCEATFPNEPNIRAFTLEQITQALVLENYDQNNVDNIKNINFWAITPITYSVNGNPSFSNPHQNNALGLNINDSSLGYGTTGIISIELPVTQPGFNPLLTYVAVNNRVAPNQIRPCMCGTYIY